MRGLSALSPLPAGASAKVGQSSPLCGPLLSPFDKGGFRGIFPACPERCSRVSYPPLSPQHHARRSLGEGGSVLSTFLFVPVDFLMDSVYPIRGLG